MRILIAEDDLDLAEALTVFMERSQFTVDTVHDGAAACDYALSMDYDAIILDIMMPKLDGIQVLRSLRQQGRAVPIMLLTAKGEKDDRVLGFDAGADDYLPKPFAPDELLSRLRAMLRRGGSSYIPPLLSFGDLTLDSGAGELRCGGESVKLSGREFQVLELFMRNPRTILSAERILDRVWGWESEISVVWVHISNLRKKIKAIGSRTVIRVNRGLGYALEDGNDP